MIQRARLIAVSTIVLCGALAVISSTQTWLHVALVAGGSDDLVVSGADAVVVLAPLSLAVLALGLALTIVGTILRYAFGVLTVIIGALIGWLSGAVALEHPTSAVVATVTVATGISGETAVSALVSSITPTAWPAITMVVGVLLLAVGVFTLATVRTWSGSSRRFRTGQNAPAPASSADSSRPHDAIDSWDDLSRGDDPTARPLD
ncbi:Trp biosynthesis-associated membrane protein [Microbacterium sp. NPDC076911]|uniref:Trp biosynthesis-associated membrane protein n=1 Tax=Microbacterium sp. NPDC076911 TaxID=3154958 RepID=UPI00341D4034